MRILRLLIVLPALAAAQPAVRVRVGGATLAIEGHSGGADAAPIAGRILEAWRAGKIG